VIIIKVNTLTPFYKTQFIISISLIYFKTKIPLIKREKLYGQTIRREGRMVMTRVFLKRKIH